MEQRGGIRVSVEDPTNVPKPKLGDYVFMGVELE
jgi:hypothetical protein